MASSIFDRLLGRTEPPAAPESVKAVTGPGAYALTYLPPLHSLNADPNRLMAEAQSLFRSNPWVNVAERAIGNRIRTVEWHLEDENGDTVDDSSPEAYQAVLDLLNRPNPNLSRRKLWGITARHLGLCGNAFWHLDQREGLAGTPLHINYINPARMTPVHTETGVLRGWVLDAPGNPVSGRQGFPGVPLEVEEVIHFTLDEPDWGIWGIGIAEALQRKIELDRLADLHSGGVLGSGGRLTGMVTPKVGENMTDDQWLQFSRDWRRIAEDPNAAKRLQIAKVPLDFTQMTASPKDLQLVDVSKAGRDDILAGWQVPLSQVGIISARGLNSGETPKYEEAAFYQGAIEPRGEAIFEPLQMQLLDRFADLGVTVRIVPQWPEFDDELPLYQNAEKAKVVPLTIDQRLEQVGKDPLDETVYGKLGQAIFIDQSMVALFDPTAEPTAPTPVPDAIPPVPVTADEADVVEDAVKADLRKPLLGLRAKTETKWEPRIRSAISEGLAAQRKLVEGKLDHAIAKHDIGWWNDRRENSRLLAILEPLIEQLAGEVASDVRKPLGKADLSLAKILDFVRARVGERIAGINATTRDKLQRAVEVAVTDGLSPAALADRLDGMFGESRAELISRTETMLAYNDAALNTYGQLGTEEVEAIDGDDDAECAARHGARYPISEALGITDHPNGTLDWIPVL